MYSLFGDRPPNEPGPSQNDIIFIVVVIGPDTNSYTNNGTDKNGDKTNAPPNNCDTSSFKVQKSKEKSSLGRINLSEGV
jgi:hypothetical protein